MPGGKVVLKHLIPAKDAFGWQMLAGQVCRITDVEGKQVGDLVLFDSKNNLDRHSISWTRTRNLRVRDAYHPPLGLTVGDTIWSTGYNRLATVTEDSAERKGIHDLFGRMCNRGMYEMYGVTPQDGCFELLQRVLTPIGIAPELIPDPLGVFMHTQPDPETRIMTIQEPVTRPGDVFAFRAEADLLCAMSTCPMDVIAPTNGYKITPLLVEVIEP